MRNREQVENHVLTNEGQISSSDYDECDFILEYSRSETDVDNMSRSQPTGLIRAGSENVKEGSYTIESVENISIKSKSDICIDRETDILEIEQNIDEIERSESTSDRSSQTTSPLSIKYHTVIIPENNSDSKAKTKVNNTKLQENNIIIAKKDEIQSSTDNGLTKKETISNIKNSFDIQSVKNKSMVLQTEPKIEINDEKRMQIIPAKSRIVSRREVLSDIDDVSTDSEFIRVNVIDARNMPYQIPPKSKNEAPDKQYIRPKQSGVKMKVNKHMIENMCGLTQSKDNNDTVKIVPIVVKEDDSENAATKVPVVPVIVKTSEELTSQEPKNALEAGELVLVNEKEKMAVDIGDSGCFTNIDAMELLTEMKRHISQGDLENRPKPANRFVIGNKPPIININEIIEIDDFRRRDLYDQIKRRTTRGSFKQCWVRVTNGTMTCYKSKGTKDPLIAHGPMNSVFQDPVKDGVSYERKFTIDFSASELFLGHERQSWWNYVICCGSVPLNREQLTNVSEAKIRRIKQQNNEYILEITQSGKVSTIVLAELDFVLYHNEEYYYFRASSIDAFLKWILTYHLRHERDIHSIENMIGGSSV
ncbi:hypothetical protein PAEPH01_0591 [Pancytospora epiphaga]|nr:hypothetical protein PAEPH01_0591 [Pancytospora epiphaga]